MGGPSYKETMTHAQKTLMSKKMTGMILRHKVNKQMSQQSKDSLDHEFNSSLGIRPLDESGAQFEGVLMCPNGTCNYAWTNVNKSLNTSATLQCPKCNNQLIYKQNLSLIQMNDDEELEDIKLENFGKMMLNSSGRQHQVESPQHDISEFIEKLTNSQPREMKSESQIIPEENHEDIETPLRGNSEAESRRTPIF